MKATELCVGNYVIAEDTICNVVKIDKNVITVDPMREDGLWIYPDIEDITPIMLTDDILLKNDIVKVEDSICFIWKHNSYLGGTISLFPAINTGYNVVITSPVINYDTERYSGNITSVHKLQNILNMFGFDIEIKL